MYMYIYVHMYTYIYAYKSTNTYINAIYVYVSVYIPPSVRGVRARAAREHVAHLVSISIKDIFQTIERKMTYEKIRHCFK